MAKMARRERGVTWAPVWEPMTFPPVRVLADLRDRVLAGDPRRLPKWGFRLADDLAVQIQPRPAVGLPVLPTDVAFDGELLFSPLGVGEDSFRGGRNAVADPVIWLRFTIRSHGLDLWRLRVNRVIRRTVALYGPPDTLIIRRRLIDCLSGPGWDVIRPDMMLSPRCLYCGRGLTDAASRARLIGPECANDSSASVPGLRDVPPAPVFVDPVADALARATLAGDPNAALALADRVRETDVLASASN